MTNNQTTALQTSRMSEIGSRRIKSQTGVVPDRGRIFFNRYHAKMGVM